MNLRNNEDKFVFELMDALRSPIITWSELWASTMPQRIIDLVVPARLVAQIKKEKMATLPEVILYLYTYTLCAPPQSEITNIYLHVGDQVMRSHFGNKDIGDLKFHENLTDYEINHILNPLRRAIYETRREHLKQQLKHIKTQNITQQPEIQGVVGEQLNLFDL